MIARIENAEETPALLFRYRCSRGGCTCLDEYLQQVDKTVVSELNRLDRVRNVRWR